MKTYMIDHDEYEDFWMLVYSRRPRNSFAYVDDLATRWLSIFCGIDYNAELSREKVDYYFTVRDEKKFSWARLKYT